MERVLPRFYETEDSELIFKITPPPLFIYIICSFFRISTATCFFGLLGTGIGAAAGASTLGWIVGSLAGLMVSPFVRVLTPRYSIGGQVFAVPRNEVNYPGAREIVLERFDYQGNPIRTFVLPRPTFIEWVSRGDDNSIRTSGLPRPTFIEWMSNIKRVWPNALAGLLGLILLLLPIGLGWISFAWMALAFSPWGHSGLLTAKIAANLMWDTMYLCPVCLPLALLMVVLLNRLDYNDRRRATGT